MGKEIFYLFTITLLAAMNGCSIGTHTATQNTAKPGLSENVQVLRIPEPEYFWSDAHYARMVPPVRLPTNPNATDQIEVWLRLPDPKNQPVKVAWIEQQERYSLVFPSGTRVDRIETLLISDQSREAAATVIDVRGTTLLPDGKQTFHVYRPETDSLHSPLVGWSWLRDQPAAQNLAVQLMVEHLLLAKQPATHQPMTTQDTDSLRRFHNCSSCHQSNQAQNHDSRVPGNTRPTDAMGFFVPLCVLQNEMPLSTERARDLNRDDPYVTVHCSQENQASLVDADGWQEFRCSDGNVPVGRRDTRRGFLDSDPYTLRVCESRRYLFNHMDRHGRRVFRQAFEDCNISRRS